MRILISGAGIAGLCLAALLKQRGIDCEIVERAPDLEQAGYVLGLYPLGGRILHGLHAHRPYVAMSETIVTYALGNGHGRAIRDFDFTPINDEFGALRMQGRSDLLKLLRRVAGDIPIRMNTHIEALHDDGTHVQVKTSDGAEAEYDLVVGADGIHSDTRKFVSPKNEIYNSHWACWTWWAERGNARAETVMEFWGAGRFVGLYPTPGKLGIIACAPERLFKKGETQDRRQRMQRAFARFGGVAGEAIAAFPPDDADMFFWRLNDQRAQAWSKGRVTLLGDSACAFLPTAGIGASMAMESAAVLAGELSRTDAAHIPQALRFYEARRRKRVEAAQSDSRKLAKMMFLRNPFAAWARNQAVRFMSLKSLASQIMTMMDEPI